LTIDCYSLSIIVTFASKYNVIYYLNLIERKLEMKQLFFLFIIIMFYCGCKERISEIKKLTPVTVRLQWHIQTQFAGYYVALEKGFYRDEGLDMSIKEGGYGKNCIVTVKNGLEEFGTKWTADLFAEGNEFISIANIVKNNGLLLVSKRKKNIKTIPDLVGKKVSIWFIGNEYQLYTLLESQNINRNRIKIIPQKWNMSQFLKDEVDVGSVMIYNELLTVYKAGYSKKTLNIIDYKDYGVGFPGHSIFTSKKYYNENRNICMKMVRASIKGWKYAMKNPDEAVSIVLKYDDKKILKVDHQKRQMHEMIRLIASNKFPIGSHDKKMMLKIERIYKRFNIIKKEINVEKIYTDEFIR